MDINDIINLTLLQLNLEGTPDEIAEAKFRLREKLEKTVIDTLLENLPQDKQEEFLRIIQAHEDVSGEVEKLAAGVPGLLEQITDALNREIKLIQSLIK